MSASTHSHEHQHDGHHGHNEHAAHGSLKSYAIGFVLSVILTAIPFWLVMGHVLPPETTKYVIMGFAAVQFVVQMIYFLHMNSKSEGGWNMLALIFTIIIVVITLAGSMWVMYHMNANMMPGMTSGDMSGM